MAKTKYQVVTAEGKVETRQSERPYTHVLLARRDYIRHRASINESDLYAKNYQYSVRQVARDPECFSRFDTPERIEERVADALKYLAGYTNEEEFVAAKRAAEIARLCPEGQDAGPEEALRWSAKESSAVAAIGEFTANRFYTAPRVVPVSVAQPKTKPTAAPGTTGAEKSIAMTTAKKTTKTTTTKKAAAKKAAAPKAAKKAAAAEGTTEQMAWLNDGKKPRKAKAAKKAATKKAAPAKAAKQPKVVAEPKTSRKQTIEDMARREGGATLAELMEATGWQAHSVRSALSTLGKATNLTTAKNDGGARVYSIA